VPEAEGGFRLEVPGFDGGSVPGAPAVAVKRAFVAALAGRRVRLTRVEASEGIRFEGLPVAAAGAPAVEVTNTGMVRPGQKRLARSLASGPFPRSRARILEVSFQGETKKARLELAPLRYDTRTQVAVLSERMLVRLDFSGSEPRERGLGISGRRLSFPGQKPGRGGGAGHEGRVTRSGMRSLRGKGVCLSPAFATGEWPIWLERLRSRLHPLLL
jgi:hypothetical protein